MRLTLSTITGRFAGVVGLPVFLAGFAFACGSTKTASTNDDDAGADAAVEVPTPIAPLPAWLTTADVLTNGHAYDDTSRNCRVETCRHNENTDLYVWKGAIYLVHRTAISQTLGPDCSLRIYKSNDDGKSFTLISIIPAYYDRDLRDPHFYDVNGVLYLEAITRTETASVRDSNVDSVTVMTRSTDDGVTWSALQPIAPEQWSFWRPKKQGSTWYSAAYHDGDQSVAMFSSEDGVTWKPGAYVYTVSADTPLETELTFMPSGRLLALVRMDGTDDELLGDEGRLRTKTCWSLPPYSSFDCSTEFDGQRLDGPLTLFENNRLFVIARKHLQNTGKKRTSLFEITGTLEGGPIAIHELGEFPSAGDTSYAGYAPIDATHGLVTWYSGDLVADRPWVLAIFDLTDIWQGTIDFSKL